MDGHGDAVAGWLMEFDERFHGRPLEAEPAREENGFPYHPRAHGPTLATREWPAGQE